MSSEALRRFRESQRIDYDKWHDGEPYDLQAFAEMTPAERAVVVGECLAKETLDWRDMEVLAAEDSEACFSRLRDELDGPVQSGVSALRCLQGTRRMGGSVFDRQLSRLARRAEEMLEAAAVGELAVHSLPEGGGGWKAGRVAGPGEVGDETVREMLRGMRDRPETAVQFGFAVSYLTGTIPDAYDFKHRPLYFRIGEKTATTEARLTAWREYLGVVGMEEGWVG